MAVNRVPIEIAFRQNNNEKSSAFGKWYPEVKQGEALSTRGLLEHIMGHGLGYPRSVVQGVLTQVAECLTELILQGQPVKLDGFGTFKLSAQTGRPLEDPLDTGKYRESIDGLRLVVIPDNTDLDKLTSKANLAKASLSFIGVVKSEEVTIDQKEKTITVYTSFDKYRAEQQNQQPNP